jgi:hypothetical protein
VVLRLGEVDMVLVSERMVPIPAISPATTPRKTSSPSIMELVRSVIMFTSLPFLLDNDERLLPDENGRSLQPVTAR